MSGLPVNLDEDTCLIALENALQGAFLGSILHQQLISDTSAKLEFLLNAFISGVHPPFKSWILQEVSITPPMKMVASILTHQGVEHTFTFTFDGQVKGILSSE